jgi:hypothetical protein
MQNGSTPETLKLLQVNLGRALKDIDMGKSFLKGTPTVQEIRARIDIKLKVLCTSKKAMIIIKRQPTEWQKTFASYSLDKGFIYRIYKSSEN